MATDPAQASFAATLVAWQRAHGRQSLPWQQQGETRDAYRVWLAEIMLQQTQVAAVIPFYRRFLERFPDVRALAAAPADDVMQAWSGLGYYARARHLHAAAKRVVDAFDGRFPDTVDALVTLPGVGRSTAGAIAAFAFGRRAPILDGNVKRVFARVFALAGPPASAAFTKRAWTIAESLVPGRDVERYTQGLMDLGATICTPRKPSCLICPFERVCVAHRTSREAAFPERAIPRPIPRRRTTLLLIVRGRDVLLERRPPIGIWGGLWSLVQADGDRDAVTRRVAQFGACVGPIEAIAERPGFSHGFTHFVLDAEVLRVEVGAVRDVAARSPDDALRWFAIDALADVGLPAPIRTLLAALR